jgi:hypothetical protein
MRVRTHARLSAGDLRALEMSLSRIESLADVIVWGAKQPAGMVRTGVIADVIVQDEYTHDAIVPWGARTIVFGST